MPYIKKKKEEKDLTKSRSRLRLESLTKSKNYTDIKNYTKNIFKPRSRLNRKHKLNGDNIEIVNSIKKNLSRKSSEHLKNIKNSFISYKKNDNSFHKINIDKDNLQKNTLDYIDKNEKCNSEDKFETNVELNSNENNKMIIDFTKLVRPSLRSLGDFKMNHLSDNLKRKHDLDSDKQYSYTLKSKLQKFEIEDPLINDNLNLISSNYMKSFTNRADDIIKADKPQEKQYENKRTYDYLMQADWGSPISSSTMYQSNKIYNNWSTSTPMTVIRNRVAESDNADRLTEDRLEMASKNAQLNKLNTSQFGKELRSSLQMQPIQFPYTEFYRNVICYPLTAVIISIILYCSLAYIYT